MEAEGLRTLMPARETAVVGISEVSQKIRNIAKAYFRLRGILKEVKPSLIILMDYPEFNLKIAAVAKRYGIPVMYYISPQIWAWRPGRVKKIASVVDKMVCILPFEKDFYSKKGVSVEYVGHPLCDIIPPVIQKKSVLEKYGLEKKFPIIGLLPGSRDHEVKTLLPAMLRAAEHLATSYPDIGFILPLAPTITEGMVEPLVKDLAAKVILSRDNIYGLLSCCNCALITSGTATLEAAIMGIPMVVVYRVSRITFFLAKKLAKVNHISLVNLIAGREVVPELIQGEATSDNMKRHLINLLEDEKIRDKMIRDLEEVRHALGGKGASRQAARIAVEMMS